MSRTTALERAFDIAKSGECESVQEIKKKLKAEGFSLEQITGPTLSRQLLELLKAAPNRKM
jgi:hypothetical protein